MSLVLISIQLLKTRTGDNCPDEDFLFSIQSKVKDENPYK